MPSPDQDELVVDLPSDGNDITVEIGPSAVESAEVILDSNDTEHDLVWQILVAYILRKA